MRRHMINYSGPQARLLHLQSSTEPSQGNQRVAIFSKRMASTRSKDAQKVNLWHVPPRSPDLNPIEKFWSWLRRELRKRDLADLVAGRLPLGKMAYRKRIVNICRSAKARQVEQNHARISCGFVGAAFGVAAHAWGRALRNSASPFRKFMSIAQVDG